MNKLLDIRYVNKFNLILFALYVFPVLFTFLNVVKSKETYYEKVIDIKLEKKRRNINTVIFLSNGEKVKYSFDNDFFNQNTYLDIKTGDSIKVDFINKNAVIGIENTKNKSKLSMLYFVIYDYRWLSMLVSLILFLLNIIFLTDFMSLKKIYFDEKNNKNKIKSWIENFNNLTKKYGAISFLILLVLIILIFNVVSKFLKVNQFYLEDFYLYKYFYLLNIFLCPLPFIIYNNLILKKIKANGF